MGHILTINWESNEERNIEWLTAIQKLSEDKLGQAANTNEAPPKTTHGVIFQAFCPGKDAEAAKKLLEDFAKEVEQTILKDAKLVDWSVQTGLHEAFEKFG